MDSKKISIGNNDFFLLYSDLLPPLEADEYQSLREDIMTNGILIPVISDERRGIIDGAHRLMIAAELQYKQIPMVVMHNLQNERKKEYAIRLNTNRRQLKEQDKISLAISMRQDKLSLRKIASVLGVHHETIRRYLKCSDVDFDEPVSVTGNDGKRYPTYVPISPRIFAKSLLEANGVFESYEKHQIMDGDLPNKLIDANRFEFINRINQYKRKAEQDCTDYEDGQNSLICGDFRENTDKIQDNSVDLIFTDPPYDKESLKLWEALADLATKKLKPSGLLVSYSGSIYLPQIFKILGEKLTYVWTAAIYHKGSRNIVPKVNAKACWKPILIYCKEPFEKYWIPFFDMFSGGQEKDHHRWEQSVDEAMYYIDKFCPKEGTLLDPMMGSGTSIIAALKLKTGIKTIGIDIDKSAYATALERVEQYRNSGASVDETGT